MVTPAPIGFFQVLILVLLFLSFMAFMITAVVLILRKRKTEAVKFEALHIYEVIKLIISSLTFVTVCITLILLVLQNRVIVMQTRYASQSVESNVFGSVTTQNLATDDICLKYPKLRPYFYSGKDLTENDPLYHQVCAAAEYLLDYYDSMATQLKRYPLLWRHEKGSWEANITDMFSWSPVLCRYLEANKSWYNDDLLDLKKIGEAKRQKGENRQIFFR
jgi:hypothetical protein